MKKIITEGQELPRGYGYAYKNWHSMTYTCYPFPINHVARAFRDLWAKTRNAEFEESILPKLIPDDCELPMRVFREGKWITDNQAEGFNLCLETIKKKIKKNTP